MRGRKWLLRSAFFQYNVYKRHDNLQVRTNIYIFKVRSRGHQNNLRTCRRATRACRKKSCKYNLMSNACTPTLVDVPSQVSKILLPSKTAKFPFLTMDYSPWSSKNSIDRNQLKKSCKYKLMSNACTPILVGMTILVSEIATFKNGQISLSDHYSPWSSKNSIDRNQLKKSCKYNLMSNACTPIFVGMAILVSEILLPSKMAKFPFPTMDYIVHGHQKIYLSESAQKIHASII